MSFINKCSTIIRRSDKEIFKFYIDNIIKIDHYDKDNNLISSNSFDKLNGMDFTNCSFCLNNNDIYGIYKNDSLKMIHIPRGSSIISKKDILTYDSKKFDIIFPYINVILYIFFTMFITIIQQILVLYSTIIIIMVFG